MTRWRLPNRRRYSLNGDERSLGAAFGLRAEVARKFLELRFSTLYSSSVLISVILDTAGR
jgi:hypothetical protein